MIVVHFGQQTVSEMNTRLSEIDRLERALADEKYALHLRIEEAEGRPDSNRARFARAALAGDIAAMNRICAENEANWIRDYGVERDHDVREEGRRLAAEQSGASHAESVPAA